MDIENPEPLSLPKTVNIHAAKTHLSKLVDEAHAGAEIILAKNGVPYARLVPLDTPTKAPRVLGQLRMKLSPEAIEESLRPLDDEELAHW